MSKFDAIAEAARLKLATLSRRKKLRAESLSLIDINMSCWRYIVTAPQVANYKHGLQRMAWACSARRSRAGLL